MQEIQAIQASTHLADTIEDSTHKTGITTAADSGAEQRSQHTDSTKVTLSARAEKGEEIKKTHSEQSIHKLKKVENQEIDYSLAMSGIPQYGGQLVTLVKYPDGHTEMVDAFSGKKITQQDLTLAQLAKENSQPAQQRPESIQAGNHNNDRPGESLPTDMD